MNIYNSQSSCKIKQYYYSIPVTCPDLAFTPPFLHSTLSPEGVYVMQYTTRRNDIIHFVIPISSRAIAAYNACLQNVTDSDFLF